VAVHQQFEAVAVAPGKLKFQPGRKIHSAINTAFVGEVMKIP
jgi:hypothetical protein